MERRYQKTYNIQHTTLYKLIFLLELLLFFFFSFNIFRGLVFPLFLFYLFYFSSFSFSFSFSTVFFSEDPRREEQRNSGRSGSADDDR